MNRRWIGSGAVTSEPAADPGRTADDLLEDLPDDVQGLGDEHGVIRLALRRCPWCGLPDHGRYGEPGAHRLSCHGD